MRADGNTEARSRARDLRQRGRLARSRRALSGSTVLCSICRERPRGTASSHLRRNRWRHRTWWKHRRHRSRERPNSGRLSPARSRSQCDSGRWPRGQLPRRPQSRIGRTRICLCQLHENIEIVVSLARTRPARGRCPRRRRLSLPPVTVDLSPTTHSVLAYGDSNGPSGVSVTLPRRERGTAPRHRPSEMT